MLRFFRKCSNAITALTTLTLFLAASTCVGQSNRGDVISNIPFPFVVANRTLPPGRYIITPVGETNLRIYSAKTQGVIVPTHSVQGKAPEGVAKVVFHRYGDAYFLSEVLVPAREIGRRVFASRTEEEVAAKGIQRELAVLMTN